jgi:DNA-binding NtrC family response regulator
MGLSILLVEDNAEDRLLLEQILVSHGHRMSWAETVRGAEKLLQTDSFGLVILDVELRDGESGIQIAHRVPRGVPVFIRSGHSTAHILQSAASIRHPLAGVSIILGKPDLEGLLREIRRLERMSSEFPAFDMSTKVER